MTENEIKMVNGMKETIKKLKKEKYLYRDVLSEIHASVNAVTTGFDILKTFQRIGISPKERVDLIITERLKICEDVLSATKKYFPDYYVSPELERYIKEYKIRRETNNERP